MTNSSFKLNSVYYYITGGCNLNCRHCWITPDCTDTDLDLQSIKNMINEIHDIGVRHIRITGGEPFLRNDIFEIIRFARYKNIDITIETNGTFISTKEAEQLYKLRISGISVSIDGFDPGNHDEFRGVKGSFYKAVEAIKALRKAGHKPQMISSLYKKNAGDVGKILIFAESIGAASLKLNPICPIGRGNNMYRNKELLTVEEVLQIEKFIDSKIGTLARIPILLDIPLAFKKIDFIRRHKNTCSILNMLGILNDGTISICGIGRQIPELNMGNVKYDSIDHVWKNSEILNLIREIVPNKIEGVCSDCIFKLLCLGKCRAHTYYKTGLFNAPYYFCQEAYEKRLFPKSRLMKKRIEIVNEKT